MSPRPCLLKVLPPASGAISWEPYLQHMGLGVGAQHLVLGLPFLPVRSPDLAPTVYTKTFGSLGGDAHEHKPHFSTSQGACSGVGGQRCESLKKVESLFEE